jgi:hypothetical protein
MAVENAAVAAHKRGGGVLQLAPVGATMTDRHHHQL